MAPTRPSVAVDIEPDGEADELALRELGVDARPVEDGEPAYVGRLELEGDFAQEGRLQVGEHERDPGEEVR